MNDKVEFGSVSREFPLDDNGSKVQATMSATKGVLHPQVKLQYSIRHRIEDPEQEKSVYDTFSARERVYTLFDTGVSFEGKTRLKPAPYYYMIEHFTMYKRAEEHEHIYQFVEQEKKELGL
jgi:hypothetical protein